MKTIKSSSQGPMLRNEKGKEVPLDIGEIRGEEVALQYQIVNDNLRHLMGEVLTVVEGAITNEVQLKAVKSQIKGHFSAKLSWLYEMCGLPEIDGPISEMEGMDEDLPIVPETR